jgi:hypothetical protein
VPARAKDWHKFWPTSEVDAIIHVVPFRRPQHVHVAGGVDPTIKTLILAANPASESTDKKLVKRSASRRCRQEGSSHPGSALGKLEAGQNACALNATPDELEAVADPQLLPSSP